MKEVLQEKYLGEQISHLGNADSVLATIKARSGQVSAAILEIKSVIEDCRAHTVGGIMAGIDIWELSVIPFLLNNSSVWGDIPKKAIGILESLQNKFYRYLLSTPRSTPTPALLWETGGLSMQSRINLRKLTFYHHLLSLDDNTVASRVASQATRADYPGLMREYKQLCEDYSLPCARQVSKQGWKKLVKRAIFDANRTYLLQQIYTNYKKLDYNLLVNEKYETKEYLKTLRLNP